MTHKIQKAPDAVESLFSTMKICITITSLNCWQTFLIFLSESFEGYIPYRMCIKWSPACYNTLLQQSQNLLLPKQPASIPHNSSIWIHSSLPCAWLRLPWMQLPLSYQILNGASNLTALLCPGLGLWHQRTMICRDKTWHTGEWIGQDANTKALRIVCAMLFSKADAAV